MIDKEKERSLFNNHQTVYGPVKSWRFGESLGIDPIFETSTCSFNCLYCQLGHIQKITTEFTEYIPTEKVVNDFKEVLKKKTHIDVITYSGSGEPTLASNLGEIVSSLKNLAPKVEQAILTNATELDREQVRENLSQIDRVILKIDAASEEMLQKINRPAEGVSLSKTLKGINLFKKDYQGIIEVQTMFMPMNTKEIEQYCEILKRINPSVVQLNTPRRPYPLSWHKENRGNHKKIFDYKTTELKTISEEQAREIEELIKERTGLQIVSVYR